MLIGRTTDTFYVIPWEFCVCMAQERRLAFLVAVYEYVANMPSRRKENGNDIYPPWSDTVPLYIKPHRFNK